MNHLLFSSLSSRCLMLLLFFKPLWWKHQHKSNQSLHSPTRKQGVSLPRHGTGSHKAGSNVWHSSVLQTDCVMSWEPVGCASQNNYSSQLWKRNASVCCHFAASLYLKPTFAINRFVVSWVIKSHDSLYINKDKSFCWNEDKKSKKYFRASSCRPLI